MVITKLSSSDASDGLKCIKSDYIWLMNWFKRKRPHINDNMMLHKICIKKMSSYTLMLYVMNSHILSTERMITLEIIVKNLIEYYRRLRLTVYDTNMKLIKFIKNFIENS